MANQPYHLTPQITVTLRDNPTLVQVGARRRVAPTDQQFLEALQGTHLNIGGPGFFVPNIGIYTSPEFDARFGALLQYGIGGPKWVLNKTIEPASTAAMTDADNPQAIDSLIQQIRDFTAKHPITILTASAHQPATRTRTCDDGAVITLGTTCLSEVNLDRYVITTAKTRKQAEAFLTNVLDCNGRLPAPDFGSPVGECLSGENAVAVDLSINDDVAKPASLFVSQWRAIKDGLAEKSDRPTMAMLLENDRNHRVGNSTPAETREGIVIRPTPGPCPTFQAIGRSHRTPEPTAVRFFKPRLNYEHIDPDVIEYTGKTVETGELVLPLLARHHNITDIHINGLTLHPFCWKVVGGNVVLDVDVIGYAIQAGDWFGVKGTPKP